ncbi:MAG TPA: esterase family protein [Verrucomicrobia bacterium]|nr:esterase family protein [Candidatus Manganitrophaceae bacterium]HIL72220.1 esterase family protein [Verrucomicrobiota bacterium]
MVNPRHFFLFFITLAILSTGLFVNGQSRVISPEVHEDRRVTFRLRAPQAESVSLRGIQGRQAMSKDEDGIWSLTLGPLEPEIYSYRYWVDEASVIDPVNRNVKKWFDLNSLVEVPGNPPLIHELQEVSHGILHHHTYASKSAERQRGVFIYTPPGYSDHPKQRYPVLFLLHGFGDDESAWNEVGRAHWITDNLIAVGEIKPMVIVMPYGHPVPVSSRSRYEDYSPRNNQLMEKDLFNDLIPLIEKHYRVSASKDKRAIVGLSMGGGHSLGIGLRNFDQFAWIGGFSSAPPQGTLEKQFSRLSSNVNEANDTIRLLWIGCGRDDFLFERNNQFIERLKTKKVKHVYHVSEGGHSWDVWRKYLTVFLQKIFITVDSSTP